MEYSYLRSISFVLMCAAVLGGPWFFGAWETIWFWPFVVALFGALGGYALRLLNKKQMRPVSLPASAVWALGFYGAFLAYAALRVLTAGVVMDAERSFLLFVTPALIFVMVLHFFTSGQLRLLQWMSMVSLSGIAAYGILNHIFAGSSHVLWMPGYPGYFLAEHRATGTYYCPNHFSGVMEILFGLALAVLLTPGVRPRMRLGAFVSSALAVMAILMSKSRGGEVTLALVFFVGVILGTRHWPARARWGLRGSLLLFGVLAILAVLSFGRPYVERFREFSRWESVIGSSRAQMALGAIRAWRSAPVFGIGPGMHQNVWAHFAASPDGSRAAARWPKYPNNHFHSYEVHSDWLQLGEEYGWVGLVLFAGAMALGAIVLFKEWNAPRNQDSSATVLGTLLAGLAMAVHSLFDFNLQMPGTVWLLAFVVALPWAVCFRQYGPGGRDREPESSAGPSC